MIPTETVWLPVRKNNVSWQVTKHECKVTEVTVDLSGLPACFREYQHTSPALLDVRELAALPTDCPPAFDNISGGPEAICWDWTITALCS